MLITMTTSCSLKEESVFCRSVRHCGQEEVTWRFSFIEENHDFSSGTLLYTNIWVFRLSGDVVVYRRFLLISGFYTFHPSFNIGFRSGYKFSRRAFLIILFFWTYSFLVSSTCQFPLKPFSFKFLFYYPNLVHCRTEYNSFTLKSYPCNKPWRPIELWDVEGQTLSG
jgi:hypothetical protein